MKFFRNLTIGQYVHKDSPIHKLDPRIKILTSLLMMILIFLTESWWSFLIIGFFFTVNIWLSKVQIKYVLRGLKPILVLIILTLFIHLFTTPGEVIFQIGVIRMTWEGLSRGMFIAVRLFLLILTTSWLTLTTSPIALTDGIERLLSFFKIIGFPAHEIAMMMTIALRFIPTLMEETEKIIKAQMSRGADFESGNILKRMKNMIPIIIPLFINAFHRADELAIAMEARCYRGGEGRTHYRALSFKYLDKVFFMIISFTIALIIIINVV
ncbi:MAG: energy-coupling factor transporter transmembrane protein EcfT [Candidatus Atribacteria bacterium]|nr:energy-coupling factor transporter transmembrane protein EcfT [Candidatus Atribacteria bacterium]